MSERSTGPGSGASTTERYCDPQPREGERVDPGPPGRGASRVREELVREGVRGCELGPSSLSRHFTAGTHRPTPSEGSAAAGKRPETPSPVASAPSRPRPGTARAPPPRTVYPSRARPQPGTVRKNEVNEIRSALGHRAAHVAIEREYRAGQLSIREIGRQHGLSDTPIRNPSRMLGASCDAQPAASEVGRTVAPYGSIHSFRR